MKEAGRRSPLFPLLDGRLALHNHAGSSAQKPARGPRVTERWSRAGRRHLIWYADIGSNAARGTQMLLR